MSSSSHFAGLRLLSDYFGLVVMASGLIIILTGFIVSDDEGFLLIIIGSAATLAGVVGQLLKRFFYHK
jgi:hypothetical protein